MKQDTPPSKRREIKPSATESTIRGLVRSEIPRLVREQSRALLVEEMEVCRRARIDLAIISDRLIGIEIKGPKDDVSRLPGQVVAYSGCFDRVVLVVHEVLAHRAIPLIPKWWGVVIASEDEHGLDWRFDRRPRPNPQLDREAFLSLLWREEISNLLARLLGSPPDAKASKKTLRGQLLAQADFATLREASLEILRSRTTWRGVRVRN